MPKAPWWAEEWERGVLPPPRGLEGGGVAIHPSPIPEPLAHSHNPEKLIWITTKNQIIHSNHKLGDVSEVMKGLWFYDTIA